MASEEREKRVLIPIGKGSSLFQTACISSILGKFGAHVIIASVNDILCEMSEGQQLKANICMDAAGRSLRGWDLIVLPGGREGANELKKSVVLMELLRRQNEDNKLYAAIGCSPALVLAAFPGLLPPGATCFPLNEFREKMIEPVDHDIVVQNNLVTAQGNSCALLFSLQLGEMLYHKESANKAAVALLLDLDTKMRQTYCREPTNINVTTKSISFERVDQLRTESPDRLYCNQKTSEEERGPVQGKEENLRENQTETKPDNDFDRKLPSNATRADAYPVDDEVCPGQRAAKKRKSLQTRELETITDIAGVGASVSASHPNRTTRFAEFRSEKGLFNNTTALLNRQQEHYPSKPDIADEVVDSPTVTWTNSVVAKNPITPQTGSETTCCDTDIIVNRSLQYQSQPLSRSSPEFVQKSKLPHFLLKKHFFAVIWPHLESLGWTSSKGKRMSDFYFFPPGIERGKNAKIRVDYFDSFYQVLSCIETRAPWKDLDHLNEARKMLNKISSIEPKARQLSERCQG